MATACVITTVALAVAGAVRWPASAAPGADPCAAARALAAAGEKERARKQYVKVLRTDPLKGKCAAAPLKALNAPGTDPAQTVCDEAKALETAHETDDARTAYKAALKKSPGIRCAKDGVARLGPGAASRAASWLATAIPDLIAFIGGAVLVVFAILMLGYIESLRQAMTRLPLFGRILRPRLSIDSMADDALDEHCKVGAAVTARIRERMAAYQEESQGGRMQLAGQELRIDFSNGFEEFAELVSGSGAMRAAFDKASDISEHTKAVKALVDLMYAALPIPRLKVSGVLNPPASEFASGTFALEYEATQRAAVTLSRHTKDAPDARAYLGLAEPAAVWVQYEVARAVVVAPVSSEEAESYAFVREGLDRFFAGDAEAARAAYRSAISLNPRNWAARVNLAVMEARLTKDYAEAIATADAGLRLMTSRANA